MFECAFCAIHHTIVTITHALIFFRSWARSCKQTPDSAEMKFCKCNVSCFWCLQCQVVSCIQHFEVSFTEVSCNDKMSFISVTEVFTQWTDELPWNTLNTVYSVGHTDTAEYYHFYWMPTKTIIFWHVSVYVCFYIVNKISYKQNFQRAIIKCISTTNKVYLFNDCCYGKADLPNKN